MNAADIRTLNERCQAFTAKSTLSREQQDVGLKSVEVSMLTEIAAQLAEANEHLECIAHPLLSSDPMTLRDQFAMAALMGLTARGAMQPNERARVAYRNADEMLEARKK